MTPPRWLRPLVFVAALGPAVWVVAAIASDFFNGTRLLGSNPIKEAEHFTGRWVLRFLVLTLAVTPVRQLMGWNWLQKYRRMLGLFAFFYATLHLLIYFLLDLELMWGELWADIVERPYITIGMTAFALLVPLAVTSTAKMVKRLGGKRWAALHRTVYVIAILGVIHFWMAVKRDITDPLIYALVFACLLGYRLVQWRRRRARVRSDLEGVTPAGRRVTA
ncbi:MAG TPA: protein-methionine-sulfoxide reductase heme-binding subunit MsrQ [Gemmatimonadaceae bacterium]|jgi:sulfoxide reductase heme-binding subunit YedZ|nr:protein-methionine-sulfoxide reductase heme-binding subunit MsrQ [Gemmatimonadaceae bacterium]